MRRAHDASSSTLPCPMRRLGRALPRERAPVTCGLERSRRSPIFPFQRPSLEAPMNEAICRRLSWKAALRPLLGVMISIAIAPGIALGEPIDEYGPGGGT